jgi:glycosyltransferase involved in cell wall biosynthesis
LTKRVVFASEYCLLDSSSGAALATAQCLQFLASCGFQCQAFCGARLDFTEEVCFEETLSRLGLPYEVADRSVDGRPARLVFTRSGDVPVTVFRNVFTQGGPTEAEVPAFLGAFDTFLAANRPDVLLTYGGGPLGDAISDLAKRRGIVVVFGLHNFAYHDPRAFAQVDYVVVPSQFSKDYYRAHVGVDCHVLPNAIDFDRAKALRREPEYLTFVNPQPTKGLYVVARIAEQLGRRRPDIRMLVVEGRARGKSLEQTGLDLSWATNLFGTANTTDPRQFYAVTKVLLMPSLWNESFGLVAAEAMLNGIPVLASNRGALPETVGDGGLLFDIPARYTPHTTDVPTSEEVEPWLGAIVRLWDDESFYRQQSEKALSWSERWHPDKLRPAYVEFFSNVHPQPRPPIRGPHTGGAGRTSLLGELEREQLRPLQIDAEPHWPARQGRHVRAPLPVHALVHGVSRDLLAVRPREPGHRLAGRVL